jgi:hypothetical protein
MMDILQDIVHRLGRIEAKLDAMENVPDRVAKLERWQAWLKGGLIMLAANLCRNLYGK